jgi:hypothetical protein
VRKSDGQEPQLLEAWTKVRRAITLAEVSPIRVSAIAVFSAGVSLSEVAGISAFLTLLYLPPDGAAGLFPDDGHTRIQRALEVC